MSRRFDISGESSESTRDVIREICNDCDNININQCKDYTCVSRPIRRDLDCRDSHCKQPEQRFDPGATCFTSIITPVIGLTPHYSGCTASVEFRMRRKNKTVTLQWEPFSGAIAANGISFLTVSQSISNTPPYPISSSIYMQYKGVGRITHIRIDPYSLSGNIFFYLNTDGSGNNIIAGDAFYIDGGSVTWIVDA